MYQQYHMLGVAPQPCCQHCVYSSHAQHETWVASRVCQSKWNVLQVYVPCISSTFLVYNEYCGYKGPRHHAVDAIDIS